MIKRSLRTLLTLVVLTGTGLLTGRPCEAADLSSTSNGGLPQLHRTIEGLEQKLLSVKAAVVAEFIILEKLETRIRNHDDLKTVPRELQAATMRIKVMQDEVAKLDQSASTVAARITKIRDDAIRRRNNRLAWQAEQMLAEVSQLQTNIKILGDEVSFARNTVNRLWDMLRG